MINPVPTRFPAYLGDGVGLGPVSPGGGTWAVGGVGSDNLGGVDDGLVGVRAVGGRGTSNKGGDGGNGELHFDGFGGLVLKYIT